MVFDHKSGLCISLIVRSMASLMVNGEWPYIALLSFVPSMITITSSGSCVASRAGSIAMPFRP